eukprot:TRINITY_DN57562_c0_g1_i1.p1 TRINITY_DN57562_c0_g1~~TRINITY_DN57562_c0_g1_i1.p1  ORF type:complete len:611 (-),score=131.93 TRINITY_DN57562_c0_g1_i1:52-1884(-)
MGIPCAKFGRTYNPERIGGADAGVKVSLVGPEPMVPVVNPPRWNFAFGPLVAVEDVIAQSGAIRVAGRYSATRPLEQSYALHDKVIAAGEGVRASVRLATGRADGRIYAVKSFRKRGLSNEKRAELKSEAEIYLTLDHPHVARLENVYDSRDSLHLVMEYLAGGELFERLSKVRQYTEEVAADATRQMLVATAYLHAHHIAHRDLKLENFMYETENSNHLKLIDFGFAKFWTDGSPMMQACGSIHYVAPEVLQHSYTEKADLWSLGVIVYLLLVGSPPFRGTEGEVLQKVRFGRPSFSSRFHELSLPAQVFVKQLLRREPYLRLSASDALKHPWLQLDNQAQAWRVFIDSSTLSCLRGFAKASKFRRAVLSVMAWCVSAEELAKVRNEFLVMDTEHRGTITLAAFKLILEERFCIDGTEAEQLARGLDVGGKVVGEIKYSMFLAAAVWGRVKVNDDVLRKTFSRFDREDSGLISAEDLRASLGVPAGGVFEGADIEELIREADTSGDGKIDYQEFIEYVLRADEQRDAASRIDDGESSESRLDVGGFVAETAATPVASIGPWTDNSNDLPILLGSSTSGKPKAQAEEDNSSKADEPATADAAEVAILCLR